MYVSNENNQDVTAYFDDIQVKHKQTSVAVATDYYPFGMPMDGRKNERKNWRYGYQGEHAEKDEESGWNQFQLRMYDPIIGRWLSVDPKRQYASGYVGMGNNPVIKVDPDGGFDRYQRQKDGSLKYIDDEGGAVKYIYDMKGNLEQTKLPDFIISAGMSDYQYSQAKAVGNINRAQGNFVNFPVTQAAFNTLTFLIPLGTVGKGIGKGASLIRKHLLGKIAARGAGSFADDAIRLTTSYKSVAPSRTYTIFNGKGQLHKFGVTDANLARYSQSLKQAGPGAYGKYSSIMPKNQAHIMEKYLRSLQYNSTGQYALPGMKIPYPVNFNTGLRIRP